MRNGPESFWANLEGKHQFLIQCKQITHLFCAFQVEFSLDESCESSRGRCESWIGRMGSRRRGRRRGRRRDSIVVVHCR